MGWKAMARIWTGYMGRHKWRFTFGMTLIMLVSVLYALEVYMIKFIFDGLLNPSKNTSMEKFGQYMHRLYVDRVFPVDQESLFIYIPLTLVAILFVKGVFGYFGKYWLDSVGLSTITDLRNDLYDRIMHHGQDFFAAFPTGTLISRLISDIERIKTSVSEKLTELARESLSLLALVTSAFIQNWSLTLLSMVTIPLVVYPISRFSKKLRRSAHRSQEQTAFLADHMKETITGVRIVQMFQMEDSEMARFRKYNREVLKANLKATRVMALTTPLMELIGGAAIDATGEPLPADRFEPPMRLSQQHAAQRRTARFGHLPDRRVLVKPHPRLRKAFIPLSAVEIVILDGRNVVEQAAALGKRSPQLINRFAELRIQSGEHLHPPGACGGGQCLVEADQILRKPQRHLRHRCRSAEVPNNLRHDFRRIELRHLGNEHCGAAEPPIMRQAINPRHARHKPHGDGRETAIAQQNRRGAGRQQVHRLDLFVIDDSVDLEHSDAGLHFRPQQHAFVVLQVRKAGSLPPFGERQPVIVMLEEQAPDIKRMRRMNRVMVQGALQILLKCGFVPGLRSQFVHAAAIDNAFEFQQLAVILRCERIEPAIGRTLIPAAAVPAAFGRCNLAAHCGTEPSFACFLAHANTRFCQTPAGESNRIHRHRGIWRGRSH